MIKVSVWYLKNIEIFNHLFITLKNLFFHFNAHYLILNYNILDHSKEIWIISDARRKTDIAWFKSNFNNVKLIRIIADECTRKERGWNFIHGIHNGYYYYNQLNVKKINLKVPYVKSVRECTRIWDWPDKNQFEIPLSIIKYY